MDNKDLKVLWMPTNCVGVNWWRMMQFFRVMGKKGVKTAMYGYEPKGNQCARWEYAFATGHEQTRDEVYSWMSRFDAIILGYPHYPQIPPVIEAFISKRSDVCKETLGPKVMVCEIDDWVHDTPDYNPGYKQGWKPGNIHEYVPQLAMLTSTAVVNATPWLAEQHKHFNPNSVCMPNVIDFNDWWNVKKVYKKGKKDVIKIGWCGGGNHNEDLRILPVLARELRETYGNKVELVVMHGIPDYLKDVPGIKLKKGWADIDEYPKRLAEQDFDIGIAPLEINKFNAGKSNIKWLEHAALKTPFVCTDFEPYKAIEHGIDGFRCKTIKDWLEALKCLIESKERRIQVGLNAYERVKRDFELNSTTDRYIEFLKGLKEGGKK